MAVYVVVAFDDNAEGKRFVEKVNEAFEAVDDDYKSRRVVGVWYKPTKFCECTGADAGSNAFMRASKTGWWVHYPCGRPKRAWAGLGVWESMGRNVLPGNSSNQPLGWGVTVNDRDADVGRITPVGHVPGAVSGERVKVRKKKVRNRPRRT
jgi:hypothetical protein